MALCRSCCEGSWTRLEATKLNPLNRWWALALGGTPGESAGNNQRISLPGELSYDKVQKPCECVYTCAPVCVRMCVGVRCVCTGVCVCVLDEEVKQRSERLSHKKPHFILLLSW